MSTTQCERGWIKSTYSNASQTCLELRALGDVVQVRDSKHPTPVVTVSHVQWTAFLAAARR